MLQLLLFRVAAIPATLAHLAVAYLHVALVVQCDALAVAAVSQHSIVDLRLRKWPPCLTRRLFFACVKTITPILEKFAQKVGCSSSTRICFGFQNAIVFKMHWTRGYFRKQDHKQLGKIQVFATRVRYRFIFLSLWISEQNLII